MTFREFIEKGEGNICIARKDNPINVTEIECVAVSKKVAMERHYFYFGWYEQRQTFQYILARKSKDKRRGRRDGYPSVVYISGAISFIKIEENDLDKSKIEMYGSYVIFLDKEEACDYVINKIKQRKLELNKSIIKINKLKFSLA